MTTSLVFRAIVSSTLLASLSAADPAPFTMPDQYSVDELVKSDRGDSSTISVAHDGKKMRADSTSLGNHIILIQRPDLKVNWILVPDRKLAMEMAYEAEQLPMGVQLPELPSDKGTFTKDGGEKLKEIDCDIYAYKDDKNALSRVWVNPKDQTLVRVVSGDAPKTQIDFEHWQFAKPAADVFEIPDGFQKMNVGGGNGGRFPGQVGPGGGPPGGMPPGGMPPGGMPPGGHPGMPPSNVPPGLPVGPHPSNIPPPK